jgi:hypothetical protein
MRTIQVTSTDTSGRTYLNTNSGNEVLWLSGFITTGYHEHYSEDMYDEAEEMYECGNCGHQNNGCDCGECHDCGAQEDPKDVVQVEQVLMNGQLWQTYNNAEFVRQVRRYSWSNG